MDVFDITAISLIVLSAAFMIGYALGSFSAFRKEEAPLSRELSKWVPSRSRRKGGERNVREKVKVRK